MIRHGVLAGFMIAAVAAVLSVRADGPKPAGEPKATPVEAQTGDEARRQDKLAKQFSNFKSALLNLAQRMERSHKPEDVEKSKILKQAIEKANEADIDNKFHTLIGLLRNKSISVAEYKGAMEQSEMLAEDIRAIINILLSDDQDARRKAEIERVKRILAAINKAIRDEKVTRAQTEAGSTDKDTLHKLQVKVRQFTEEIVKAMSKGSKGSEGQGEGKKGTGDGEGKGEGKGDGEAKGSGKGKGGQGGGQAKGQGQEQEGQDKGQDKGDGQPSQNSGQAEPITNARRQVKDATKYQRGAEDDIKKPDNPEASKKQDKAIEELEKARKTLEEYLRQLRQEELERLLANLMARCKRMLEIQKEVLVGTIRVDKALTANPDRDERRSQEQSSLRLSDREQEIVREARSAIDLLENEGSAVAFPEAFIEVHDDAQHVTRRLVKADVGALTQEIERDIIALLEEMIEALKKAIAANKSGKPGQSQPGNQSLIDLLAELKMIRSMQMRVNVRTRTYAQQYPGEQAKDPDIKNELEGLAARQQKIFEITNNIYRGKNR